jgi:hypothetical protein
MTSWLPNARSERVTFFLDQDVPDDLAHWLRQTLTRSYHQGLD